MGRLIKIARPKAREDFFKLWRGVGELVDAINAISVKIVPANYAKARITEGVIQLDFTKPIGTGPMSGSQIDPRQINPKDVKEWRLNGAFTYAMGLLYHKPDLSYVFAGSVAFTIAFNDLPMLLLTQGGITGTIFADLKADGTYYPNGTIPSVIGPANTGVVNVSIANSTLENTSTFTNVGFDFVYLNLGCGFYGSPTDFFFHLDAGSNFTANSTSNLGSAWTSINAAGNNDLVSSFGDNLATNNTDGVNYAFHTPVLSGDGLNFSSPIIYHVPPTLPSRAVLSIPLQNESSGGGSAPWWTTSFRSHLTLTPHSYW